MGRGLEAKVDRRWLWKGRRVYMFDGTAVTMPDTPENQQAYPQVYNQKPGVGLVTYQNPWNRATKLLNALGSNIRIYDIQFFKTSAV